MKTLLNSRSIRKKQFSLQEIKKFLKWSIRGSSGFLFFHKEVGVVDIFFPRLSKSFRIRVFSKGVKTLEKPLRHVSFKGGKLVVSVRNAHWYIRWICYRHDIPVAFYLINKDGFAAVTLEGIARYTSQSWNGVPKKGPLSRQLKLIHRLIRREE